MLTPQREMMFNRWFLLGGLIAVVLAMPTAIWQAIHHFPMLEELSNVKASNKNTPLTMLSFFAGQVLQLNPLSAPIWLGGLYFFLFAGGANDFASSASPTFCYGSRSSCCEARFTTSRRSTRC